MLTGIILFLYHCVVVMYLQYWDAINICRKQHVPMTEQLVESLSPLHSAYMDQDECNKIIEAVGEVCYEQAEYHLATKKFTQAGNKIKVCVQSLLCE